MKNKLISAAAYFLFLAGVALFLSAAVQAGDLDPSGPPDSTMTTLDEVPPTWSQKLPCDATACPRFELVLDDEAILDKETGLVWEQSPGTGTFAWAHAQSNCNAKNVGGRQGWYLPTAEQLASLVDRTQTSPALPAGHPFSNVQSMVYWSATTGAHDAARAWGVYLRNGAVNCYGKAHYYSVWCVRGEHSNDAY
jgi:hypothetical protein